MIKQYFTDGLIQIAILLSLLRTDLNNINLMLHGNLIQHPEVQEMLLGQTAAYIPSNIHNQFYGSNSLSNFVHPKNYENDFNSVLFRDLQSLSRVHRIENTNISAFLVDAVSTLPDLTFSASTPNNNHTSPNINSSASATLNTANVESQNNNNVISDTVNDNFGAIALLDLPEQESLSTEPSEEDLDLIDVLWRQDIDLGVSKEIFDVKLRQELEREREIELQKKRDKHKELELLRQKLQDEQKNQEQQWLTNHFTQDGETGEWVPLRQENVPLQMPQDIAITDILSETQLTHLDENLSLQEALDFLNEEVGNFTIPEPTNTTNSALYPSEIIPLNDSSSILLQPSEYSTLSFNNSPVHEVPMMSPPQENVDNSISYVTLQPEPSYHDNDNNNNQTLIPLQSNVNRQESFEDRWQDLVNLLELPPNNQNDTSMEVNTTSSLSQNNSVLLQNATLPVPMATDTNITSLQTTGNDSGLLVAGQEYNASIPDTGSLTDYEWNTDNMFLTNISNTINQTEPLVVEDLLLDDEDLDRALNEGLDTIQMLDDTTNDSAISMGSNSPFQEPHDSSSMSPYDGVEGATGGSDYGSPSYSKSSKYDGEDYHYNYNSYSHSHSESSPSNYSTSSNDTEFNKAAGGSQHIHHNHTYPAPPGMQPKEVKKYMKTDRPKHKGPTPKDAKRAAELKVPFTVDQIIESPVEEFNEMLTKYKLNNAQLQLIRDIRRRGKNKVAAQNCRKRKMDLVLNVEDELQNLKHQRDKLMQERQIIDKQTREMKARFSQMYQEIFNSLRDEHGHPYDPDEYSLQQSSDGDVFLVPRNVSAGVKVDDQAKTKKRKNHKK